MEHAESRGMRRDRPARDVNGVQRPNASAKMNADGVWQETVGAEGVTFELVWVPPGEFWMGSPDTEERRSDDEARHRVQITLGFWLGKTPVTEKQWEALTGEVLGDFKKTGPDAPRAWVSWSDCQSFVRKLSSVAGPGWRLPTEAEWEFACRAGSEGRWCFGDDESRLGQYAWYRDNARDMHPVGSLKPNAWGLYDMHGNVAEFVQDGYYQYPMCRLITDPAPPPRDEGDVCIRGGGITNAWNCRSATRSYVDVEDSWGPGVGFRLARTQL